MSRVSLYNKPLVFYFIVEVGGRIMERKQKQSLTTISYLSLLGFLVIGIFVYIDRLNTFDFFIIGVIQGWESPVLTSIMTIFSFIGSYQTIVIVSLIVAVLLYVKGKHTSQIILLFVTIISTAIVNQILKYAIQRERPSFYRLAEATGYSFPSGHSMGAFAVYGMMTLILLKYIHSRRGQVLTLIASSLLILFVGMSRIYLGVHFPSDVIGGYLLSLFLITIILLEIQPILKGSRMIEH